MKTVDFKFEKKETPTIEKIISLVNKSENKDLDTIKDIVSGYYKGRENSRIANIVKTVIEAKIVGDKIILRDGLFTKPLKLYMSFSGIDVNCLTNDQLFIRMLSKKVMDVSEKTEDEKNLFFVGSDLDTMLIASENFISEEVTTSGLIQDYDGLFSGLHQNFINAEDIVDIVKRKPEKGNFFFNGDEYQFFGNKDLCVVCPIKMKDEEIIAKLDAMKFFKTDGNKFKDGERIITADKKVKFLYQEIPPESFCPAYWFVPSTVKCNVLFTFSLDYNYLFDYLYDEEEDKLRWPDNLFYWDTMNQCFDFLGVFALTNTRLKEDKQRQITTWVDTFNSYNSILINIRNVYTKIERVFRDFFNSFLNTSSYSRFINMSSKIEKTYKELDALKKKTEYTSAVVFVKSLPFCQLISNQLKNDLLPTLKKLFNVVKSYIKGTNATNTVNEIRTVGKEILNFLPGQGRDLSVSLFPFIVADGALFGGIIEYNNPESDPIYRNVDGNIKNRKKQEVKTKKKVVDNLKIIKERKDILQAYFMKYLKSRPKNSRKISEMDYSIVIKMLLNYLQENENSFNVEYEKAVRAQKNKRFNYKKDTLIELFIKDYLACKGLMEGGKKKKKPVKVEGIFYDTATRMNMGFDIERKEYESDEEDMKEEQGKIEKDNKQKEESEDMEIEN